MKFARIGPPGSEIPALIHNDEFLDLRPITADINGDFLSTNGPARARTALLAGHLPVLVPAPGARFGAPIARPSAVICVGMNYAAHAAESGSAPPEVPIIFFKAPNTVAGPDDEVTIPRTSVKTDWEVELAVVIGSRTTYLDSPAEAWSRIAGYTIANDVSERDFQLAVSGGQWSKGKSAAGFTPTGPWLVTPEDVDASSLRLRSWVNGEPRQDSSTRDLIFGIDTILFHLSQYMVLEPGDLVLTGTPEGVALSGRFPYLSDGDVVELEIDGLGRQRQTFVSYERTAGDTARSTAQERSRT